MLTEEKKQLDSGDETSVSTLSKLTLPKELSEQQIRKLQTVFLAILAALCVLYAMHATATILIPVTLSVLIALILQPIVRLLGRLRVTARLAAAIVVLSMMTMLTGGIYTLSGPVSEWVERSPELLEDIEAKIEPFRAPLKQIQDAQKSIEKLADPESDQKDNEPVVEPKQTAAIGLAETITTSSNFLINSFFVLVLVYLMLATDGNYLRKLVTILPSFKDKRRAVETTKAIQDCVSRYLLTITMINIGLGVFTGLAMWWLDMPNPVLWGLTAALMNYIPYVGPAITWLVLLVVGFLTFDDLPSILLPAFAFFVLTMLEGQVITPTFAGQKLELSPVAIFIFLAFMGWLWGVIGMLIAIPLLASIKIICAEIVPLNPIAVMLGHDN